MRLHIFEQLTNKENGFVNAELKRVNKLFSKGLITKAEADYMFQERMMKELPKESFEICTNRDDFIKEN